MTYISDIKKDIPTAQITDLEQRTFETLKKLGIEFERVENDPVSSMEECIEISNKLGAEIRKTIFLTNSKKNVFFLVVMPAEKSFKTKNFCERIGCSRVSFASEQYMKDILGVLPGSASVMSLLNDVGSTVKVVFDKEIVNCEWFACNPGANTSHIKIKTKDLINLFIPFTKHKATVIDL